MPIRNGILQPHECSASALRFDGHESADRGAEQHRKADARLNPARIESALVRRRVLGEKRGRAAHFAAGREALQQARDHDQHRRPHADLVVGRREADQRRAARHQQNGQRERRLSADLVRVHAEHDAAHRPHEKAHAEGRDGEQQRGQFIAGRKEQLRDDHREKAVDGEVEPFEPVAEHGGDNGAAPLLRERVDGECDVG